MRAGIVRSDLKKPRILVVANQKGGVGKTTTAINLGTALAAIGERVMLIDLDPQGNASTGLGIDYASRQHSSYDVLVGNALIQNVAQNTYVPHLSIVPSTLDLLGFETETASEKDRVFRLRHALNNFISACEYEQEPSYTYFILDCPPAVNLLTMNAMVAAQAILVPLQCEFLAMEGLGQMLRTIEEVQSGPNPELQLHGIILTMYDSRNKLSSQVVEDVRDVMGKRVYKTVIPRNVRISEAPSHGKPVLLYDYKCLGSQAYLQLASEVIQREKSFQKIFE
ncbi:MAG: ParA family protein [Alphaproteobacteria bacterium]|nr:ParA family protein [Alphaproteobacteria bacterium]